MTTKNMVFMGKWAFFQDKKMLALDEVTGTLCLQEGFPFNPLPNQRFNVYGENYRDFLLQASNGKYLIYTGESYQAVAERAGSIHFAIDRGEGYFGIIDKGLGSSKSTYYLSVDGLKITRIPTDNRLPFSTRFHVQFVTPALAEILKNKGVQHADLSYADLASVNFTGFNFTASNLSFANLSNAVLDGTDFSGVETNLTGANFSGARMIEARMDDTKMPKVNLSKANLQRAKFIEANLKEAILTGANLTGAQMYGVALQKAVMVGANVKNTDLPRVQFDGADLTNADFTQSIIYECNLWRANLTNANFTQSTMDGCNLQGANLTNANFTQSTMDGCNLQGANLTNANLSNIDFTKIQFDRNTNFNSAKLRGTNMANLNLQNIIMTHADLTNAVLDEADLSGAEMSHANLTTAKVRNGAKLYGASLSNAILKGADFTGAQLGTKQEVFHMDLRLLEGADDLTVTDELHTIFTENGCKLSSTATLTCLEEGNYWHVSDETSLYSIAREDNLLRVWKYLDTTTSAVLAGAYMPDAIFTNANLYAVNMTGVSWYGVKANAEGADLEDVNFSNANLSSMNLQQARLYGTNFDFANLIGANLSGAILRPSISQRAVSFVSASLQSVNFTKAQLVNAVLTKAAVSLNEGPFFTLDSSYINDLNQHRISQALRNQFTQHGYSLTSRATVLTNTLGMDWTILNENDKTHKKFQIIKLGNILQVFGGVIGVHLFDLSTDFVKDLDARKLTNTLRNAFAEHGYSLISGASIDQVLIKEKKWHLQNEETDSRKFQTGYVEFCILHYGDSLHVYALALIISRVGDNRKMEKYRYYLSNTQITVNCMDESTTCPNGQKVEMYLKHPERLTWEMMMTAI